MKNCKHYVIIFNITEILLYFYNKKNNPFTDEEVAQWRQLYAQGQDYKDLYEMSDKRVAISSFQNMLCGKSYKNLPYYSKKQQKWVNK